ncbi:MAG: AraC family transcriptional regulator [Candidatus Eremiobacteraeota bacterium]|nr:AraC family transcriptional regulator [Candidatus Eremiobacteraeota bacterium]
MEPEACHSGGLCETVIASEMNLSDPIDVGCGTIRPVRSSALAAIYYYAYNPTNSPRRVDDKTFDLNCLLVTTQGHWQVNCTTGRADIDSTRVVAGAAGRKYGCRHDREGNSSFIAVLGPTALDPDSRPIFSKQILPSSGALQLVERAARSSNENAFETIVFTLFENASSLSNSSPLVERSNLRMQRVKRFIEFHASEQLGLPDIASEVGISPFTLVRQFRSATGRTPYGYMLEIRLEHAKKLLKNSDDSIRAISRIVGFLDPAYFSRFFKSSVGCSPSLYRAACGGREDGENVDMLHAEVCR